jgi:hypothetical protein
MKVTYRFASLIIAMAILVAAISCGEKEDSTEVTDNEVAKKIDLADAADSLILDMVGVDSLSVLDVLAKQHTARHISSLKGAYVLGIDDIGNGDGYFWMYSVNGVMGEVACDKYITKTGDRVRWHYRMSGSMQM